ncbi:hypothetical protein [uncultured Sulfitobacter sp.]|uniref:hypothetical protein n=1 Tax=uncultured Sulfitobacter sp. TaxID=191468 RepID=UPI002608D4EB|nr:hypothetical protein [uncultured Sulfitobacter sp.]
MRWPALIYVIVIGPLHHLASVLAAVPAALLLPPDILVQLAVAVPVFCTLLYWAVPALLRRLGLLDPAYSLLHLRVLVIAAALLIAAAVIAATAMGYTTPAEATALNLVALMCLHIWLIRKHLRG